MSLSSFSAVNLSDSLPQRSLIITFILPGNAQAPITIEKLRTEVSITQAGQEIGGSAKIKLHAVAFEPLFQLLKCNHTPLYDAPLMLALSGAEVKIEASNESNSLSLIFHGKISRCHTQLKPPHRIFEITAHSNLLYNDHMTPLPPYTKPVWASQILKDLCSCEKISLENNGFDYLIQPPFSLNGTLLGQVGQIVNAQNGFFHFDALQNKLLVTKNNFSTQNAPLLLTEKELIQLSAYSDQLLSLRCLFQANLQLGTNLDLQASPIEGRNIYLNTSHQLSAPWNGQWIIHAFSHVLSTEKRRTHWETHLQAHRLP
ncbi:hypothetical protein FAI41_04565 [Acetobacteraceae bacterium]|nr:hypothetical protein FAI41_04565 [Acetobacteraceae bacterium]